MIVLGEYHEFAVKRENGTSTIHCDTKEELGELVAELLRSGNWGIKVSRVSKEQYMDMQKQVVCLNRLDAVAIAKEKREEG